MGADDVRHTILKPNAASAFGQALKEMGDLLIDKKVHEPRLSITIEESTVAAPRVRINVEVFMTDEIDAILRKMAKTYMEQINER